MAYFVGKELHIRPYTIMTEWTCEELLVAYGHYANQHAAENYAMISPKDRATHKDADGRPAPLTWLDRWAVLFVTPEQMEEMSKEVEGKNNPDDLQKAAQIFFQ